MTFFFFFHVLILSFALCLLCVSDRDDLDDVLDDDLDDGDDEDTDDEADILRSCKAEDFETRQRRAFAASVLDRPEQLMMYAQSTSDVSWHVETVKTPYFSSSQIYTDR